MRKITQRTFKCEFNVNNGLICKMIGFGNKIVMVKKGFILLGCGLHRESVRKGYLGLQETELKQPFQKWLVWGVL